MKTSLYDQEYVQNLLQEDQSVTNMRYPSSTLSSQIMKSQQLKEYNQNYSSKTATTQYQQSKAQQSLTEKSYNELKNNLLANKNIDLLMKNNTNIVQENINKMSPSKQQQANHNENLQPQVQNASQQNYQQIKENIRPTSTDLSSNNYLSHKLAGASTTTNHAHYNNTKHEKQKYRVGTLPSEESSFDKFEYLLVNENNKKPIGRQSTIVNSSASNSQQNNNIELQNNGEIGSKNKPAIGSNSSLIAKKYYQQRGRENHKETLSTTNLKQQNSNLNYEKIVTTTATACNSTPKNGNFKQNQNSNQNLQITNNNPQSSYSQQQSVIIPGNYQSYTLNNTRPQSQYAPRTSNIENKSVSLENFEFAREKKKQQLKEIEQKLQMNRQKSIDNGFNKNQKQNQNYESNDKTTITTTTGNIYSNYLMETQKLMDSHDINNNITSTIKNSFLNYKQRTEKNSKISINPAVSLDLQKYGTKQKLTQNLIQEDNIQQQTDNQYTQQQNSHKIELFQAQFDAKKNSLSSINTTTEQYQNQMQNQVRLSQKSTSTNSSVLSNNITASLNKNNNESSNNNIFSQKNENQMKTLKKQNFKKDSLQIIEKEGDTNNSENQEITLSQKIQQTQIQLQNQEQLYKNLNQKNNQKYQYNNFVSEITTNTEKTSSKPQYKNSQQNLEKQQNEQYPQSSTYLKLNKNVQEEKPNQQQQKQQQQSEQEQQLNLNLINDERNNQIKVNYRSSTPQNNKSGATGEFKQQQTNPQQNSLQSTQKKRDEYQEYKKLQEKLNFLENKILSIKTNIEINQNSQMANGVITEKNNHNKMVQQAGMSHQKLLQQKDLRLSIDKQMSKNLVENNFTNESNQKNNNSKTINQNQSQSAIQDSKEDNTLKTQHQLQQQNQKKNSFFSPSNKIYQTLHTGQTPKTSTNHQNEVGFAFFNNNTNAAQQQSKQIQQQQQQQSQLPPNQQQTQQQKHLKKVQQSQQQNENQNKPNITNNKMTKSQQISTYQKIMLKNESLRQSAVSSTTSGTGAIALPTSSSNNSQQTNSYINKSAKNISQNNQIYNQQSQNPTNKVEESKVNLNLQKNETLQQQYEKVNNRDQISNYSQNNYQNSNSTNNNNVKSSLNTKVPSTTGNGLQSLVTQINKGNFLPAGFTTTNKQFQKIQQEQIQKNSTSNDSHNKNQQQQQQQQPQQQYPKSFLHNRTSDKTTNSKGSTAKNASNNNNTQQQSSNNNTNNQQNNLATSNFSAYRKSQIQKETQQNKELAEKKLVQQCKNLYYLPKIIHSFIEEEEITYFIQLFREHLVQTMQAINFSKFLRPVNQKIIDDKRQNFAKKNYYKDKKTLIFDLDETLIHCNDNVNIASDVVLPIQFPNGDIIEAGINIRPYTFDCLKELSLYYEIIVFTASHSCYANVVLDYLDPNQEYIQHRLFRENCVQTEEGIYIKDLRVIGNRDINNLIIIDNAAYSFGFHIDNGIPIIPYYDNKEDTELKDLTNYLKKLHAVENIKDINSQVFKLNNFAEFSDPALLAQNIYSDLVSNNNQLECC